MSLLDGFKANKAISTLLDDPDASSAEIKDAIDKIKQIGPSAVPKLIDALAEPQPSPTVENLLVGMLDNRSLKHYMDGLTDPDKRIVNGVVRILIQGNRYDPNKLISLFDDADVPKNALLHVLVNKKSLLDARHLLTLIENPDKNVAQVVFKLLDEVASEGLVSELSKFANNDNPIIRFHITRIISRFDTDLVARALVHMLSDPHKAVRQAALAGLGQITRKIPLEPIIKLLRDPDMTVQSTAIDTLIKRKDPGTVGHLIEILQDKSEYVRRSAVEILNEIGDPRAIKDLLSAMRDKDWWVKVRAADALSAIGGPRVVEAMMALIKEEDEFLRRTAVEILNSIKDERAALYLIEALNDKDWWVRERAADALAQLKDQRAIPALITAITTHGEKAQFAVKALAKFGGKETLKLLLPLLKSAGPLIKKEIITALEQLTDAETFAQVEATLASMRAELNSDLRKQADATMVTVMQKLHGAVGGKDIADEPTSMINTQGSTTPSQTSEPVATPGSAVVIDAAKLPAGHMLAERYKVIRTIGQGAFGVVILVEDTMVNEEIILKFLNPQMASDENVIQRFIHELRFARKITHENIIRIYDFLTFGKSCAISMEYFSSHSLAFEIKTNKKPGTGRAVRIFRDICRGITVAHNANVVHRDLKPANILIDDQELVKIVDFGLAAAASSSDSRLTKSGILVGTPTYMAPEQVRARAIDARTDIYAIGIMMYELFTGRPPYKGEDHMATLFKHVEGRALPAKVANPEISQRLSDIIMKAMARNPDDRYQKAAELQADLDKLLAEERL